MNYKQTALKVRLKERAEKRARYVLWGYGSPFSKSIFTPKGNWVAEGRERTYVTDECTLRHVGAVQNITRSIDHNGWYTDHYQDALLVGHVYQLPAKKHKARYLAAYLESESGNVILSPTIFDSSRDAAFCADSMAQYAAEQSREFHAKDAAEQETERLKEEISETRRYCLALLKGAKVMRKSLDSDNVLCRELRKSVTRYMSTIAKKRERIAALADNYWLAVEGY